MDFVKPQTASPDGQDHPLSMLFEHSHGKPFHWLEHQGRELLLIEHLRFQAVFSRQGGQLLHFQPRGERPFLWCAARWPKIGNVRGGVQVCWPWFGRHPHEGGWPYHGLARLSDWRLKDMSVSSTDVQLLWRLQLHDWQAELIVDLGEGMSITLNTLHDDSEPCIFSHGLHAYWHVSDVSQASLFGLEGAPGRDVLLRKDCLQEGELRINEGINRHYRAKTRVQLHDSGWQRSLHIEGSGNSMTGVWHPGERPLSDIDDADIRKFICIQTACCDADSLLLAPGVQTSLQLQARLK